MPVKPSSQENEHFAQVEFERRKQTAQAMVARLAAEEQASLKALHWMRCPKDGSELLETELRGVKVDICSTCGGMWLDAGELDALARADRTGLIDSFRRLIGG
jgi:uncharacterized protein